MAAPKALRDLIVPGATFRVTNHYITSMTHPCYGTQVRTVGKVNSAAFYWGGARQEWPRVDRFERDEDGTVRLYGGGVAQKPTDLFLTLVPVKDS